MNLLAFQLRSIGIRWCTRYLAPSSWPFIFLWKRPRKKLIRSPSLFILIAFPYVIRVSDSVRYFRIGLFCSTWVNFCHLETEGMLIYSVSWPGALSSIYSLADAWLGSIDFPRYSRPQRRGAQVLVAEAVARLYGAAVKKPQLLCPLYSRPNIIDALGSQIGQRSYMNQIGIC